MGHMRVVLKTSNEAVMNALAGWLKGVRSHPTVIEESPEYDPQSNGVAERCVLTVRGLFKKSSSALQSRLLWAVSDNHPSLTWRLRQAACLHNR